MRVATALGFLALAAMAVHAQSSNAAVVTNIPALGQRVGFLLDPNMPTTGAISITESGTTWIVYGTTNTIQWYNSSCVVQGTPDPATWSATGCVYNVSSMYPVTALIKTGTNMFWAVANDTLTLYTAQTATTTFTVSGSSFDLAALSYPSNPSLRSHTVWNGFLYIGSRNVNGTGMSAVRKIDVSSGKVSWTAWSPNPQSNYPVSIATLTGGTTVAVAQSSTPQDAVFAPFDDSTGAAGNATLSLNTVEGTNGCSATSAGGYICNVALFTTTTVNGIFYIASTTLSAQLIAVDFTTGFWATAQTGFGGSNTNVLSAFGTWILLAKGGNVRLIDTTKIPVTALTKTGGVIPSASLTGSLSLPGSYTPLTQAVIYSNTTNTFWLVHTAGIATATVADFQSTTTTTATAWWWYWFPFASGTTSTGYTQLNLQGAWVDASNPSMLYATWGNSFTGYTATGSVWGFNTTSKMAAWRFGDNYDARGPAIWVPATNAVGGLWYGVANAANSVYGRRVLLGWAADASLGQVLPNVASSGYTTWSSDTMHLSYSNISGLLSVVSYSDNTLTLYNATTMAVNASYTTTSSSYSVRPSMGVITVGTMHCASTYYNLRCVDWVSGASSSFTLSSNSIAGQPIVVGNRYVIARDSYYTVSVLDMSAKSPTAVTQSVSSGSGYISAQPAGWLATDGSLVLAVPMSSTMMRVFYGAETASATSVDIATSGTGLTTATPTFTTNALAFGGYLWVAGNVSKTVATGSNSYTYTYYGQITRIPVSTATVAKAYTKAQASLWVMPGTDKVGNIKNLFASPLFPTMLFTLGDTFTGWDTATGNTYFSVAPLPGFSYFTASNSEGNYDYFPTVDPTNRGVIVGFKNSTTGIFAGWAVLSPLDGTLVRLIPNPANSATGTSFIPQSVATYNGNSFIMSGTHICEYATLAAWPLDRVPNTQDPYDARVCATVLGLNPTYGFLHIGDWYFVLINGILVKSKRLVQSYQSMVPFTISGSPGGAGGNAPADDDSKAPVIIGVIVAIVIVAIIVVVVVKKLGSGGGSGGSSQGTNYNEMGSKGV